jgi:hypothetical protein
MPPQDDAAEEFSEETDFWDGFGSRKRLPAKSHRSGARHLLSHPAAVIRPDRGFIPQRPVFVRRTHFRIRWKAHRIAPFSLLKTDVGPVDSSRPCSPFAAAIPATTISIKKTAFRNLAPGSARHVPDLQASPGSTFADFRWGIRVKPGQLQRAAALPSDGKTHIVAAFLIPRPFCEHAHFQD